MIAEESFVHRYLEPADRLNEVRFGLIMVFTFSLTAGLTAEDNPEGPRELLITSGVQLSPPGCAHAKPPVLPPVAVVRKAVFSGRKWPAGPPDC